MGTAGHLSLREWMCTLATPGINDLEHTSRGVVGTNKNSESLLRITQNKRHGEKPTIGSARGRRGRAASHISDNMAAYGSSRRRLAPVVYTIPTTTAATASEEVENEPIPEGRCVHTAGIVLT
ncbi:hypothetical protein EVAR_92608_1 [Eumeta japonica]|uniref:Uncharacterized protein n=1 Tax=Eumeta variegata TaxID=151549 RepID=A0A4C1SXI5_EUMVA|nr:hypothetical protein EVAR_92608_1 [Eumeta japonica]